MKDEILIRMLADACKGLERVSFPVTATHLIPTYNALLAACRANHPNDPFLTVLQPLEYGHSDSRGDAGPEVLRVLLGQLHIVLESYADGNEPATVSTRTRYSNPVVAPSE